MSLIHVASRRLAAGLVIAACAAPMLLSGCGKKEAGKSASQVLAKVNGDEISVHQVNNVLSRQPNLANAPEAVQKQVLEKLIDRQLAYQQAMKEELDRKPEVMLAIEEAKREIIASAYLKKTASGQAAPTEAEAVKYFGEHPELFSQRRIYRLRELALPAGAPQAAEVKAAVAQGQTLDAIAARLKAEDARFGANAVVRAAEQLPIEAVAKLNAAGDGQLVLFEAPTALLVYQVLESQAKPVDQAAAVPKIMEYLANQSVARTVEAEMKRLREAAKIEYVGETAKAAPEAAAEPAPAAAAPEQPAGQTLTHEEAAKGVAGLK
ncbi:MAG: EpsD family peptidyl-prolyl cis-trans isomerase [Gallionellaceae bacterium]|nr:EpsD family peptidyl-prolyl cis-trans isomerase [Gallionellaceae bacterium]